MSLCRIHLKNFFCQVANQGLSFERHLVFSQWSRVVSPHPWNPVACVKTGALVAGVRLQSSTPQKSRGHSIRTKKEKPEPKNVLGNVGRLIPHNIIQVISENGEDMGKMTKNKVIQIMEDHDLKLVPLRETADPPVYKLMTGKQLFEEQTKLREKRKLSSGPKLVQVKEMSFVANIDKHDLEVKKKHLSQWIEKKNHVRITVLMSRIAEGPDRKDVLQDVMQSLQNQATYSSAPKESKDGRALICVLRPMSAKELQMQKKGLDQKNQKKTITVQKDNLEQSPSTEIPNP